MQTRKDCIALLEEIAVLLELKGENPFKTKAYINATRRLESISDADFATHVVAKTLQELPGLGEAISLKLTTFCETGKLPYYETLRASIPQGLIVMLSVPSLGPKKVKKLFDELQVDSLAKLKQACIDNKISGLSGFGERSQVKILEGIQNLEIYSTRHLWWDAKPTSDEILMGLKSLPGVELVEAAGSLRRLRETVGDLDFILATSEPQKAIDWFCSIPELKEVTAKGDTKVSIRLNSGIQVDLRIVPKEQFPYALHHFTGSKDHNVAMRQLALSKGLTMSEWGLVPVADRGLARANTALVPVIYTEKELFALLGLQFIPPELREAMGEIEAAQNNALPELIKHSDIRGALHNHTNASDGHNTLEEMVAAADALGWEYIGIADHSKASVQANGLSVGRLLDQVKAIRAINDSKRFKAHILAGTECDILTTGELDYADDVLKQLDYVVASVHNSLGQEEEEMTKRLIKAIENPYVDIIGHLTGRVLLRREASKLNFDKVIDAAAANKTILELNAHPTRLDLDWRHWLKAADKGVLCCINPDAHSTKWLQYVDAGVNIARKGWLTKEQVLNTRSLADILTYFR